jgi:hypothetical protein
MHLHPLGCTPIRLTFAVHESYDGHMHVEAYLAGADPQQCALAAPRAHISTTIQLSFSKIYSLLVTLAGYCEGFMYQYRAT